MYTQQPHRSRAGIVAALVLALGLMPTGPLQSFPPAHNYVTHMYSTMPGLTLVNYLGKIAQALALTSTNQTKTALLYSTALLTRCLDGTACFTAALTETPSNSRSVFNGSDGPFNRFLFAIHGGFQISAVPFNIQLLSASKRLSRCLKANPALVASLKKARDKRIINATLGLGIMLLTHLIVKSISLTFFSSEEKNAPVEIGLSFFVSTLLNRFLLERAGEQHNIEAQLMVFAKRFEALERENKPFFSPPGISISHGGTSQRVDSIQTFQRLSAHEVRFQDPEGNFESLSSEDLERLLAAEESDLADEEEKH